jgi:hypothetical protein
MHDQEKQEIHSSAAICPPGGSSECTEMKAHRPRMTRQANALIEPNSEFGQRFAGQGRGFEPRRPRQTFQRCWECLATKVTAKILRYSTVRNFKNRTELMPTTSQPALHSHPACQRRRLVCTGPPLCVNSRASPHSGHLAMIHDDGMVSTGAGMLSPHRLHTTS